MLFIYHTLCPAWWAPPQNWPSVWPLSAGLCSHLRHQGRRCWLPSKYGLVTAVVQLRWYQRVITLNRNSSVLISSSGFNIPLFSRGTTQVLRIFDTSSAAECSESDFARTWSEMMLRPGTATSRYTSLSLAVYCHVTWILACDRLTNITLRVQERRGHRVLSSPAAWLWAGSWSMTIISTMWWLPPTPCSPPPTGTRGTG